MIELAPHCRWKAYTGRIGPGQRENLPTGEIMTCPANCPRDRQLAIALMARLVNFGINIGLERPMGDVFTDQKLPGLHVVLGDTFAELTGAKWSCPSWIGFTAGTAMDVDIDRVAVLRGGRYLL